MGERASLRKPDSMAMTAVSSARSTPESWAARAISVSCALAPLPSQYAAREAGASGAWRAPSPGWGSQVTHSGLPALRQPARTWARL